MKFFSTPKGLLTVELLALTLLTGFVAAAAGAWLNLAAAVGAAVLIDVAVALLQRRSRIFPDGALLTGLIVAMVLSPGVPWWQSAFAAAVAILSKHLLKIGRRPIFNPAAFGLLAALLLFRTGQSWWGALPLLPVWCIALLLIAGAVITERVNKFPQVLAFLGVYMLLFLFGGLLHVPVAGDAFRNPFIHSALFLAFFMVTDPPTSPAKYGDQVIFGILAAVISVADYLVLNGLSYLLVGLLVANGWSAWRSRRPAAQAGRLSSRSTAV